MADEVEIENPVLGRLKATGQNLGILLSLIAAIAAGFGVYLHFAHEATAKEREGTLIRVLEKLAEAQVEGNKIHSETNCLIGYQGPPANKAEFCKRVTR